MRPPVICVPGRVRQSCDYSLSRGLFSTSEEHLKIRSGTGLCNQAWCNKGKAISRSLSLSLPPLLWPISQEGNARFIACKRVVISYVYPNDPRSWKTMCTYYTLWSLGLQTQNSCVRCKKKAKRRVENLRCRHARRSTYSPDATARK